MNKILSCAAVVGLLVASSSSVFAGGHGGSSASHFTPAFESKQTPGSTTLTSVPTLSGPAAFAPGQQKLNDMHSPATAPGKGAAVFAPGHLK